MADISTLVNDINSLLVKGGEDIPDEAFEELGRRLAETIKAGMKRERRGTLRMSSIGKPCNRQIYYGVNDPEGGEPLRGPTYMKFLTGHIMEDVVLFLAEQSGHRVEGRQDTQEIRGILGHRDAVIDGMLVDVKTASTFSYKKFESGGLAENDSFGYILQLQSYLYAGQDDPLLTEKDAAAFLVLDKTLGNICLDIHKKQDLPIPAIYDYKKQMVAKAEPPARGFSPEPDGKSGNMKLGTNCSYCDYKKTCYPGLRTFLYSNGPRHLTTVAREPKDVPEVT